MSDRENFERWYVEIAFDLGRNPIGSRYCSLQWRAWQAAISGNKEEIDAIKSLNGDFYRVIGEQNDKIDALKAENEKLRKAAQDMLDWYNKPGFSMRFDRVMDNLNAAMAAPDTE